MSVGKLCSTVGLLIAASLLLSSCAMPGATPVTTNTSAPTRRPKATSTSTPRPTGTPLPTATPNLTATKQVEDFTTVIQGYYGKGFISTTNGSYTLLHDTSDSWAELGYYNRFETGLSPTNFVIESDLAWKSASAAADMSGCGFAFREQPNGDNYMLFISLQGYLRLSYLLAAKGNYSNTMGLATYGLPAQTGSAHVTLIAEENIFRVLVNGKLLKTFTGLQGKLTTGYLSYAVVSGTNKSYGTNCLFRNTVVWEIQQ